MLKLLHTADWQIGRVYSRFEPEDAYALQEARFTAVEGLAQLAQDRGVSAVLVAGDVFDSQSLSERTVRRMFNALEAFDGDWIFISGNHDALLAEGVWQFAKRLKLLSERVHLLEEASVSCFDPYRLAVLPAPLTQRHTVHDLTQWFDEAFTPKGYYRIGMAHGSVQGVLSDEASRTNPIAAGRAMQAGLDYLALGDWHGMKQIDERTWYSGTPEPDRFRNNDAGCALIVSIDQPGAVPHVERVQTYQFRWEQHSHAIEVDSDIHQLATLLHQFGSQTVLELTLSGRISLEQQRQCMALINEKQARLRSLQVHTDELLLVPSAEDIAALNVDGYVAQVLDQLRSESEEGQAISSRALVELASILDLVQRPA
ncbi:DNA repair exonuclease [Paenalcaligenes niemegkensis]|uniref:metallophosphoesterase family protein n=1 Tax=Paenalcaligenes niemegkensis TaxID=2895469 RepID=UPI001EE94EB0|nr:DNA repair exonuclease [Paenalcaligenes niemegkensis]MCQ9616350.1 DNA repair exonuclease [Paenalcaligenes niemegkensis]